MGNCNCDSLYSHLLFTARKRSWRRLCFYRCLFVHGGVSASGSGEGGVADTPWQTPFRETVNKRAVWILLECILVLLLLHCNEWPISCIVITIVGPITGVNVPASYSTTHYSMNTSHNRNRVINLNCQGSHFFYPVKFPDFSLTFPDFLRVFPDFFLVFTKIF